MTLSKTVLESAALPVPAKFHKISRDLECLIWGNDCGCSCFLSLWFHMACAVEMWRLVESLFLEHFILFIFPSRMYFNKQTFPDLLTG